MRSLCLALQNEPKVIIFVFQDPKLYITTFLEVHKKYSSLIENAFRNDPGFIAALDKACRRFINNNYVTQ